MLFGRLEGYCEHLHRQFQAGEFILVRRIRLCRKSLPFFAGLQFFRHFVATVSWQRP